MRRVAICSAVFILGLFASGLRFRLGTGEMHLSEALQKSAYARVAKAWSAPTTKLAAGWGLAHLPMSKLGKDDSKQRIAASGLPPRLSVLLLGKPGRPQMALITAEVLSVPARMAKLLRAYAGEVLAIPSDRIIVVATHTHAGPRPSFGFVLQSVFGAPEMAEKDLAAAAAHAADKARQSYRRVRFGQASSRFSTSTSSNR